MAHLKPSEIVDEVRDVLATARQGKGTEPCFLTAFQVLDRLPIDLRTRLISERTIGGIGAGASLTAPGVVSKAAIMAGAEVVYLDSVGISIEVAGQPVLPGYGVFAAYRLLTEDPVERNETDDDPMQLDNR